MEWRNVVGSSQYEISEDGQLRRRKKTGGYFYPQPGVDARGYHQYVLSHRGITQTRKAASLVMAAFVGPRPAGLTINHKDGCKTNNHYTNLEYCSAIENVRHAYRLGLMPAARPRCALKLADHIKQQWQTGAWATYAQLANAVQVSARVVALIIRRQTFVECAQQTRARYSQRIRQEYQQGQRIAQIGEQHRNAKLSDDQRGEIIMQALSGVSKRQLARRFGVAHTTVNTLLKNFATKDKYKKFVK